MEDKNNYNKKHRKKAFTLIELLAVIIILGVLMIIAIPSVTKYIEDSRKSGYVSTAKELAGGVRNLIHSGSLDLTDKDTTYYIDSKCIDSSNGVKTPYGELTKAYVAVNYTDEGYDYYWTSVDDAGIGVKKITNVELLDTDSIERDITEEDILNNLGVDARHNYLIVSEENGCSIGTTEEAPTRVDSEGNTDVMDYPIGRTKKTLSPGDIVKIGSEEFYFLSRQGDDTILIARYNLKVGIDAIFTEGPNGWYVTKDKIYGPSDPGYGLQSSECFGRDISDTFTKCTLAFSETNYWDGQVGVGKKYVDSYVYDSNSNLYQHFENYKVYLEGIGVTIKEIRTIKSTDFVYDDVSFILHTIYYWGGNCSLNENYKDFVGHYRLNGKTGITQYSNDSVAGARPVIVI